ncbi:MAG: hypothetical protein WBA84_10120 [Carnobacterium sp.]|uniref:hypothetical protein n=1 Tax=Carnobacterium sp. TaxID=48221 RepID=UPI003C74BA82
MRRLLSLFLLPLILVGCGYNTGISKDIVEKDKNETSESEKDKKDEKIYTIDDVVEIKDSNGKPIYEINFTEIKDVTKEEIEKYGSYEETWINTYSNGIGEQAVKVTWKIRNIADELPLISFPIGLKVIDEEGETSLGGWVNRNNSIYGIDGNDFLEEDQDVFLGDTKSGAGYYILKNTSSEMDVLFTSERYNIDKKFEFSIK